MPNLWHCNHFHGNRLWRRKNKIMMTSLQDQMEKPSSMQEKLFFRHKLLWWQQGKIKKIIADVGKDPQTCHTNVLLIVPKWQVYLEDLSRPLIFLKTDVQPLKLLWISDILSDDFLKIDFPQLLFDQCLKSKQKYFARFLGPENYSMFESWSSNNVCWFLYSWV